MNSDKCFFLIDESNNMTYGPYWEFTHALESVDFVNNDSILFDMCLVCVNEHAIDFFDLYGVTKAALWKVPLILFKDRIILEKI